LALAAVKTSHQDQLLIVDDDERICIVLRDILEAEGYLCHYSTSLDDAYRYLQYEPYDLVISDVYFGESGETGLELIDHVMESDDTVPIILLTGYPTISQAVDAIKRGAIDFLSKPCDRDLLLHQVSKALQERRLRRENRRLQAEVNKTAVIEKLNRQLHSRINELTHLYTISEGLNDFLDSSALFNRIAHLAASVTGAQRVSVMVFDRSRRFLKIRAAQGVPDDVINKTVIKSGEGIAGQVAKTGQALRKSGKSELDDTQARRMGVYRTKSWLSIPLMIGGEVLGVINQTDKLDLSDFSKADEQIMFTLVEKAGIKLENQALYEGLYSNMMDTLNSLVTTIEAKDPYTREHSQRVTDYAMELARFIGLGEDKIEMVNFAGMLHDIGKIGVRDEILTKSGKLTSEEYEMIKMHPDIGERIVKPLGLVAEELGIIRHHHERFDGGGYPDGIAGENIPLLARIVGVTDAFDAMTTTRSYRKALPVESALEEMRKFAGTQFDPDIVHVWIQAVEQNVIPVQLDSPDPS
jgi:response regulator RpfG family c-di-GMP phosphodiesterase